MITIPTEIDSLKKLHSFLNMPVDHSDPAFSQISLDTIRRMTVPCEHAKEGDIQGVSAYVGDNVTPREHMGSVTIRCRQAEEWNDPNMPSVTCKVLGGRCVVDQPKPSMSGTAMNVVS